MFKLSDNTIKLIKNFSDINQGMVFNPGKVLQVLEPNKAIFATAKIDDDLPDEFVIHDLSRFLGALGLHDKATMELKVEGKVLEIVSGSGKKTLYRMTSKENVIHPTKAFNMPTSEAEICLSDKMIDGILSDASSLGLPHVIFTNQTVTMTDIKNDGSDIHTVTLPQNSNEKEFKATFKLSNFSKLHKGVGYCVKFAPRVAHFESEDGKLNYYMAVEVWS